MLARRSEIVAVSATLGDIHGELCCTSVRHVPTVTANLTVVEELYDVAGSEKGRDQTATAPGHQHLTAIDKRAEQPAALAAPTASLRGLQELLLSALMHLL